MLWYGLNKKKSSKKVWKKYQLNLKNKYKFDLIKSPVRASFRIIHFIVKLPFGWEVLFLKKKISFFNSKIWYFFSNIYFFKFALGNYLTNINFDPHLRLASLSFLYYHNSLIFYTKFVYMLFRTFSVPYYLKLKFRGKGYYIFKNFRNTITPQMGFAHRIYVYSFSIIVRFLSKVKILLFGLSKKDIFKYGLKIKQIRPIKIFTGRGIRFSRQIIYRKVGKVSSYR